MYPFIFKFLFQDEEEEIKLEINVLKKVSKKCSTFEPVHDKTYNKTCVTSKHSAQHVHSSSTARVLVYPSFARPEALEGECEQRRL